MTSAELSTTLAPIAPAPTDEEVLARMRTGDHGAYVLLYERYVGAARRLARSILHDRSDVDDVVSEVFAASFAAIRRGRGPRDAFGPYVLSSVRRECYRSWRRPGKRRETPTEPQDVAQSATEAQPADPTERAVLEEAFGALPDNLRTVLWLTEVEGLSHGEVAMRTASTGPAVAAMAMRARRALAESYLHAHVGGGERQLGPECRSARRALARVVRGTASDRQRRHVDEHVASCAECARTRTQLHLVNQRLRELAPPALLGALGWSRFAGAVMRGQFATWLAGSGPLAVAVTGAVTAALVLPAGAEVAVPTGAEVTEVAAVAEVAELAKVDVDAAVAVATSVGEVVVADRISDDAGAPAPAQIDIEPADGAIESADPLDGLLWPSVLLPTLPIAPSTTAGAAPTSPQPGPATAIDSGPAVPPAAPPQEPDIVVPAPAIPAVPVPDIEAEFEIDVPDLPALPDLPGGAAVAPPPALGRDVTVEVGADGVQVDIEPDGESRRGPSIDVARERPVVDELPVIDEPLVADDAPMLDEPIIDAPLGDLTGG